jgi:hypothetical protein
LERDFCEAKMQTISDTPRARAEGDRRLAGGTYAGSEASRSLATSSMQTPYPSPRCKHQGSLIPLHLLFRSKPALLGFAPVVYLQVPYHSPRPGRARSYSTTKLLKLFSENFA